MDMRRSLIRCLVFGQMIGGSLFAVAAQQTDSPAVTPVDRLYQQVLFWEGRNRPDMARKMLDRLLSVDPNNPRGLAALVELENQEGHYPQAQAAYQHLAQVAPQYPGLAALQDLTSMTPQDRAKLRGAVKSASSGNVLGANAEMDKLFPHGPPDGPEAIKYWMLKSRLPGGLPRAQTAIRQLAHKYPDDSSYRLANDKLEERANPSDSANLDDLQSLAELPPPFGDQARQVWRDALLDYPSLAEGNLRRLQVYLKDDPDDSAIQERVAIVQREIADHQRLISSPAYKIDQQGSQSFGAQRYDEAIARYAQVLANKPDDLAAVSGTGYALLREGHYSEAELWFKRAQRLDPTTKHKWQALIETCQYWGALQQARALRTTGHYPEAQKAAREAIAIDPKQTEGYSVLGQVAVDQGDEATLREAMSHLPRDKQAELQESLRQRQASSEVAQADQALLAGKQSDVVTHLTRAMALSPQDPWIRYRLAKLYAAQGKNDQGAALFDPIAAAQPVDPEGLYADALFQSSIDRNATALTLLDRIPPDQRSEKIVTFERRVWVDGQLTSIEAINASGQPDKAQAALQKLKQQVEPDPLLLTEVAYAWDKLGRSDIANALLMRIEHDNPTTLPIDWHLRYASYLTNSDQPEALQSESAYLKAHQTTLNSDQQQSYQSFEADQSVADAEKMESDQQFAQAESVVGPVLDQQPTNDRALRLENRLSRRNGNLDKSIDGTQAQLGADSDVPAAYEQLTRVNVYPRTPEMVKTPQGALLKPLPKEEIQANNQTEADIAPGTVSNTAGPAVSHSWEYKSLATMLDERDWWLSGAYDVETRSGTPGETQYVSHQIPIELKIPVGTGGSAFLRTDQVDVGAGTLNMANTYAVNTFGSLLICNRLGNCPTASSQYALGRSYTLGYADEYNSVDLGSTPIGFPIVNWVGGIRHKFDWGPYTVSAELARRAVTETLLSYAGTIDPRTGQLWGGVLATGVKLGISLDNGGDWGYWANLRYRQLTGTNVQTNYETMLIGGVTRRLINQDDRLLSTGLTAMMWHFNQDSGEMTYGQGGYYSPQRYFSLTLPLTYAERMTRLSYEFQGSVFGSWATTNASPYYPITPGYQNLAGNPYYSNSSGFSIGYSALASLEYQLTTNLYIGNSLSVIRSPYYAPNYDLLYFRYSLDKTPTLPVGLQPVPVIPTSSF